MAKSDQYFPYCKFCICGLVTYSGLVSYPGCITTSHQHSHNRPWTLITNKRMNVKWMNVCTALFAFSYLWHKKVKKREGQNQKQHWLPLCIVTITTGLDLCGSMRKSKQTNRIISLPLRVLCMFCLSAFLPNSKTPSVRVPNLTYCKR